MTWTVQTLRDAKLVTEAGVAITTEGGDVILAPTTVTAWPAASENATSWSAQGERSDTWTVQ